MEKGDASKNDPRSFAYEPALEKKEMHLHYVRSSQLPALRHVVMLRSLPQRGLSFQALPFQS